MPLFEFDLESFSTVEIQAPDAASARLALDAVLLAVRNTEYTIGAARVVRGGGKPKSSGGRPADARQLLGRMLELRDRGLSIAGVARELRVHRSSVHRALKWAETRGG